MRHGKKVNHLSRKKGHRRALLSNLANQLIQHKRITTTVAKAKALRVYVEPLITKAKNDSTHNRRVVFSYLQDKESIKELFGDVSGKIGDRPGGYTRILRTENRAGDNAEMCIIELVDYNEVYVKDKKSGGSKRKRTRRGGKKSTEEKGTMAATAAAVADKVDDVKEDVAEMVDEIKEETAEMIEDVKEETTEIVEEVKQEVAELKEEAIELKDKIVDKVEDILDGTDEEE